MPTLRIGMLLFPRMTQLDLTGPFEVFSRVPDAQVLLLSKTLEPIEADTGLRHAALRHAARLPAARCHLRARRTGRQRADGG